MIKILRVLLLKISIFFLMIHPTIAEDKSRLFDQTSCDRIYYAVADFLKRAEESFSEKVEESFASMQLASNYSQVYQAFCKKNQNIESTDNQNE